MAAGDAPVVLDMPHPPNSVSGSGDVPSSSLAPQPAAQLATGSRPSMMASLRNLLSWKKPAAGANASGTALRRPAFIEGKAELLKHKFVQCVCERHGGGTDSCALVSVCRARLAYWAHRHVRLEAGRRLCVYVSQHDTLAEVSENMVGGSVQLLPAATGVTGKASFKVTVASGDEFEFRIQCSAAAEKAQQWVEAIQRCTVPATGNQAADSVSPAHRGGGDGVVRVDSLSQLGIPDHSSPTHAGSDEVTELSWSCTLCSKKNLPGAPKCVTCGRAPTFVPSSGVGTCNHSLVKHRRMKAMSYAACLVCNKAISGIMGKCLKCKLCGVLLHTQCLRKAQLGKGSSQAGAFAAFSQSYRSSRFVGDFGPSASFTTSSRVPVLTAVHGKAPVVASVATGGSQASLHAPVRSQASGRAVGAGIGASSSSRGTNRVMKWSAADSPGSVASPATPGSQAFQNPMSGPATPLRPTSEAGSDSSGGQVEQPAPSSSVPSMPSLHSVPSAVGDRGKHPPSPDRTVASLVEAASSSVGGAPKAAVATPLPSDEAGVAV